MLNFYNPILWLEAGGVVCADGNCMKYRVNCGAERSLRAILGEVVGSSILAGVGFFVLHGSALAQPVPFNETTEAARQLDRHEQKVNAIRQRQEPGASVRGDAPAPDTVEHIPDGEAPCHRLDSINIESGASAPGGADSFDWLRATATAAHGADSPIGRCIGQKGLNLILRRMQNALVQRGYITSRVGLAPQDLKTGRLAIALTPGRVQDIRYANPESAGPRLGSAFPIASGDILNLRAVEQGLENFKRVPSQDADIAIEPSTQPGHSNLVVTRAHGAPFRGTVSVDDAGSHATGKHQGSITLAYDNPAQLNDLAYLTLSHDLSGQTASSGTDGLVAHYSVPFGYSALAFTYDQGRTRQSVAGATQNYTYSGKTNNTEARFSHTAHRSGASKTTLNLGLFVRESRNFIEDTEVEVQHRRVGGWVAGVDHRHYFGSATVDASLSYRRGTNDFGGIDAPEDAFGEGTSRFGIIQSTLQLSAPFTLATRAWNYQGTLRTQNNTTRLAAPQHFSIGGRHSVRGFDGETVLAAERGWLVRNEISTPWANAAISTYLGLDYGEVDGPNAELLVGQRLAGAVLGLRGAVKALQYEVFVGTPLNKPVGFYSPATTAGFDLSYSF